MAGLTAARRSWPALRAALIALAMLLALIDGCPLPPRRRVERTAPAMVPVFDAVARARRVALRPFRVIDADFKLLQRWQLFPLASRKRWRMWIEARTGKQAPWQLVYRVHDADHAWRADTVEYRRIRGAWNPTSRGIHGGYGAFATWAARTLFLDDPTWVEVRVRMEEVVILPRGGGFAPTGRFADEQVRLRSKVLP